MEPPKGSKRLGRKATVEQARGVAGHDYIQWGRFYVITKDEAHILLTKNMEWNWKDVPADEKAQIRARINTRLSSEAIPQIDDDVFSWRMSIIIYDIKKWASKSANSVHPSAAPDPSASPIPNVASSASGSQQTQTRSYDPIRDV
ncbi:hypothetical protein K491DRAFT_697082 [Lophiostoma macrostomum CBS 122681]|uniref:Uncharacterized protein n=1 Tax=Lophiostoma macrostomum CBS 122681 TaxID=1314788 RepID=A0A6A6SVS4_9PLEO|nr:hypothetical protein K491DRAFT_697082 [Lophiostoma macrostomum CBS 122681]